MRRIILTVTLLALFLSVGILGCDDNESPCENYTEQEKAKSYEWAVGNFGKGEECSITKHPEHFKISELENGIYNYEPLEDFEGTDTAEITTLTNEEDGINVCKATYRLTFTVSVCGMKTKRELLSKKIYDPCPDYTEEEKAKKYEWAVGEFGARESCKILKQAEYFKISELDENANYTYEPEEDFLGSDTIEIETETSSEDGLTGHVTVYKIEFTITECGLKAKKTIKETQDVKYKEGYIMADFMDGCSQYVIDGKGDEEFHYPPKNLPDEFKTHKLKILVNFTITDETKYCNWGGDVQLVVINRIKKDIE